MSALDGIAAAALSREATAPVIEFEGRWYGWGELRHVADRLGAALDASGATPQAPVALVARNRPSAIAALLGLIARRRTVRMIYPFQSASALARDVERRRPAVVVAAVEDFSEELRAVLRTLGIGAIALGEMDATTVPGFERTSLRVQDEDAGEPRIEILTSGTTGAPKPFALSYALIARHHIGAPADLSQQPPTLLYFPLGNITGIYSTLPPLLKNQRAVLLDRFSIEGWHDYVRRFRPAVTGLPPAGVRMVLDADVPREDLASIERLGTGAAPLDPNLHRAFEARYGIPILLSYGATEFGGPVASMTPELHAQWGASKLGSVGRALPGVQLRVVDSETGEMLPAGREGVLEVVAPRIGPQWIRTSDIGLIDEDGFVFLRGRADGAIMRGGFKLLPETIERALLLHPAVAVAAAVGIPDRRLGQVPAVVVEPARGVEAPAIDELEAHLRAHLPATHIPVAWRFVDEMPRTPSLKIDQPAVRRLFAD